ncbi:MAG TPA: cytochrome c3 family protein [Desulfuromonadales bacterium]|nr:cytochrome c3 family protein [Desulfuromonadales bacterium]
MKKLIVALMLVGFTFTLAYAVDPITYEAKNGNVTFDHNMHKDAYSCKDCHEGAPGPMEIDKNAAHGAACKDCHKADGGPTKCNECHKK